MKLKWNTIQTKPASRARDYLQVSSRSSRVKVNRISSIELNSLQSQSLYLCSLFRSGLFGARSDRSASCQGASFRMELVSGARKTERENENYSNESKIFKIRKVKEFKSSITLKYMKKEKR